MLESWVEAGLDPAQFWRLTPGEIGHVLQGAARRIEREKLFADSIAWNGARLNGFAWHDPKNLPSFEKFRGGKTVPGKAGAALAPGERRDWRAMKAALIGFNAAMGGELIRR